MTTTTEDRLRQTIRETETAMAAVRNQLPPLESRLADAREALATHLAKNLCEDDREVAMHVCRELAARFDWGLNE